MCKYCTWWSQLRPQFRSDPWHKALHVCIYSRNPGSTLIDTERYDTKKECGRMTITFNQQWSTRISTTGITPCKIKYFYRLMIYSHIIWSLNWIALYKKYDTFGSGTYVHAAKDLERKFMLLFTFCKRCDGNVRFL